MRNSKRALAGIAAGALALGALTLASAPAASAKPSIKPKASLTGTVAPVRATFVGTQLEAVPLSQISWTSTAALTTNDTIEVTLTSAPSPTAQIAVAGGASVGVATTVNSSGIATPASQDTLSSTHTALALTANDAVSAGSTGRLAVAVSQAGTYTGFFTTNANASAGVVDTVSFAFTTTGRATSMTVTPASQTTSTSGTAPVAVTLKDAAGNTTQPLAVDVVAMSASSGAASAITATNSASATGANPSPPATSLWDGVAISVFSAPSTPGTYTVTATPGGTLPSGGVTAQSAAVVVSGTILETPVTGIALTVPTNAYADTTGTCNSAAFAAITNACWQVPSPTTATTVRVTGTVGATYRFAAATSAGGAVDGTGTASQPVYKTVTIGADGTGTMAFTIGGNATVAGGTLTVTQVGATGSAIGSGGKITATQANPTIAADSIYAIPYGSVVAALGTSVKVNISVNDQFGNPVANSTVRAYRTSTSGALLSTATTNASGIAEVTVSGAAGIASGSVESYVFTATNTGGSAITAAAPYGTLSVTYTTSGAVTSMTVLVAGGAASPILNTTTAVTSMPYLNVPYTGTVTGASTSYYTVATDSVTVGTTGNYATFTPSTSPANTVTVTVPTGLKVTEYDPSAYTVRWNSALAGQSVSVASGQSVYVFGTKTGVAEITFTSGAITTKAKVLVDTPSEAAYNVALTPAKQTLEQNAFGNVVLTITDAFGNGVSSPDAVMTIEGEALLAGTTNVYYPVTGADGSAKVTVIAGRPGTAKVTAKPESVPFYAVAWQPNYLKPAGFPDPVKSASADIVITKKESRTIAVLDSGRTTVNGKPGVFADGDTDGFAEGDKLAVMVRFPGQTSYEKGSATPAVDKSGAFGWERKTGKKTYVYFTSADGVVTSNTVIIPAK